MKRLGLALVGAAATWLMVGAPGSAGRGAVQASAASAKAEFTLLPGTDQSRRKYYTFDGGVTYHVEISGTVTRALGSSPPVTEVYDAFCISTSGAAGPFRHDQLGIEMGEPGDAQGGQLPYGKPGAQLPACNAQHRYSFDVSPQWFPPEGASPRFFWAQPFGYQGQTYPETDSGLFDMKITPLITTKWKSGFRFTQRGYPDGAHTIRTQTGGAGSIAWDHQPLASSADRGKAARGSTVLTIDEFAHGNLRVSIDVKRGYLNKLGTRRFEMVLEGLVSQSNDPHCTDGLYAAVTLVQGFHGVSSQIKLETGGHCRSESWTSANPNRVSVLIEAPHQVS